MASCVTPRVFICSAHAQDFTARETALKGGVAPLEIIGTQKRDFSGKTPIIYRKDPIRKSQLRMIH